MNRRLSSAIWSLIATNLAALLAVLVLAYGAGAQSGGLSILDLGALPSSAGYRLMAALAISLVVPVVLLFRLGNRIVMPVQDLWAASSRLVEGDYNVQVETGTDDELSSIGANLNRYSEQVALAVRQREERETLQRGLEALSNVLAQVARGDLQARLEGAPDAVGTAAESLNAVLESHMRAFQRLRKAASDLGNGAASMARVCEQMKATAAREQQALSGAGSWTRELAAGVAQLDTAGDAAARESQNTAQLAEVGVQSVRVALQGIGRVRESLDTAGAQVRALGEHSLQISDLINVINDIREQGNVVAFNAALHAAKTGEDDRGSAIVAEQVRKLAEQSRAATRDLVTIMKGIQADTGATLGLLQESVKEVEACTRLAENTAKSLAPLAEAARHTAALAHDISLNSRERIQDVGKLDTSISALSEMAREVAEGSRQLSEAASQLSKVGEQLNESLAPFRVGTPLPATLKIDTARAGRIQ